MKYLLVPLVLMAGQAMACPGDAGKNAMAPASGKAVATVPAAQNAKVTTTAPTSKATTKVATKPAAEPRKTASL